MSKICLGTVQFGLDYGINNDSGQVSPDEVARIMDFAINNGINHFDTASVYGNSEIVLGDYFHKTFHGKYLREEQIIMSKLLPKVMRAESDVGLYNVKKHVERSLQRLKLDYLDIYFIHTPEEVEDVKLLAELQEAKEMGLIRGIGLSAYELEHALCAIECGCVDVVQLPYNLFDHRLEDEVFLTKVESSGIKIHARSPFLQGLFMMDVDEVPDYVRDASTLIESLNEIVKKYNIDIKKLCIQYAIANEHVEHIVLGVDTIEQLIENVNNVKVDSRYQEAIEEIRRTFVNVDKRIIFPSLWRK